MKFIFCVAFLTLYFGASSQSASLSEIDKLIQSYKTESDIALIENAEVLLLEMFSDEEFVPVAKAHFYKAYVMSILLKETDIDDPAKYLDDITSHYNEALEKDQSMSLRSNIMTELYYSKIEATQIGNKKYEEEDYNLASTMFDKALGLNQLEIKYPRVIPLDTSMMFTGAVYAALGKDNKKAITQFEKLAELKYGRKEIYSYLISLYEATDAPESKINRIKALQEELFPEK